MAIQRRISVQHSDVFPMDAVLKPSKDGVVTPVIDFNAEKRADGSRAQQVDKETGLLVWQVTVIDLDVEAGKKDTALTVKFLAPQQPIPPSNKSGLPWIPVEFVGLSALPYVDDNGSRPRIAWSYRAEGMVEPGAAAGGRGSAASKAADNKDAA
ncbi:hypothetical protein [Luteipulveratus mongoliensis]|uniref:Plasmid replication, integration and excision activator n=1 Tax=Luteipulveratus mongoliensis TaxID=571913 RepID=A0A0K1JN06_9MICO|nr:hypothetical protein [Luteipulveratus mongoliensis]AKU18102.1 hypothetical protein VV02_23265 [Luteipulveratus mongoliensis]